MVGQFKKPYLHRQIEILRFPTPARIQKIFNITSKCIRDLCSSILNNIRLFSFNFSHEKLLDLTDNLTN